MRHRPHNLDPVAAIEDSRRPGYAAPAERAVALAQPHWRRRITWAIAIFLTLGLAAIMATRVSGQAPGEEGVDAADAGAGYESIPMHPKMEEEAIMKRVRSQTKSFATTGDGDTRMVSAFFGFFVPAKLTAPDAMAEISQVVEEVNVYLGRAARATNPQVAPTVTRAVFAGMKKVALGNYHPPGRISAITIMSRLDAIPADNRAQTPPIPYLPALPILLQLYQDEANPDGIRAAALQGLHRQVMYGFQRVPAKERGLVTTEMTKLLDSDPPDGRDDKVHAFLQRYAVDLLKILRPANDSSLGVKLINISTEPDAQELIALHSVAQIGGLGKELRGKVVTPNEVLISWARLAKEAFRSELKRLQAYTRPDPALTQPKAPASFLEKPSEATPTTTGPDRGMMGAPSRRGMEMEMDMDMMGMDMMGMDMMGMGMGMGMKGMAQPTANPQPPEVIASRRKLNHVLQQLHRGVTGERVAGMPTKPGGLLASLDDGEKPLVEKWVGTMESVVQAINRKSLDNRKKYVDELAAQYTVLREWVGDPEEEDDFAVEDEFGEGGAALAPAAFEWPED